MSSITKISTNKVSTPVNRSTTVNPETNQAYIDFHNEFKDRAFAKDEIETAKNQLSDPKLSEDKKKRLLFRLAHTSLPEAYYLLQDFYFKSTGFLQEWTTLCLEECQMFLESELIDTDSDDEQMMISSLGGGDGKRLRFWVVLSTKNSKTKFDKKSRDGLTKNLNQHFAKFDSIIEDSYWGDDYLLLTALQSMDVAIDDLIVPIMKNNSDLLKFHYFVVNTGRPTDQEIEEYLSEIADL